MPQYRIAGELNWCSNSGNALLAVSNPAGSGKRLVIRSLEITSLTSSTTPTAGAVAAAPPTFLTLARATVAGGISVPPIRSDTAAAAFPATVRVLKRATVSSPLPLRRVAIAKQFNPASGLSDLARQRSIGRLANIMARPRKDSDLEGIVIRAGEAVALYASALQNSIPLRVTATLARIGSPNRSFHVRYVTACISADEAIFAFVNDAGSGESYTIRSVAVEELGTFDSPYLQLVPIGSVINGTNAEPAPILKLDSASPAPSAIDARMDVPLLPFGLPENALADSSAGSPRGFNYLKTKDFLGPVYRTIFPEGVANRPGFMPDFFGSRSHRMVDAMVRKSAITVREGEGIALVSAAETATAGTVGVSGWSSYDFAMTISVEAAQIPTIGVSGMVPGSRYRVERVSDGSLVTTGVADGTGAFTFEYLGTDVPLSMRLKVRKATSAPLYKPFEVAFTLTSAGVSIPVSQTSDA